LVIADWSDVLREPRIARECPNREVKTPVLEQCWDLTSAQSPCPFLGADRKCAIYATRPYSCVSFIAGSPKCRSLRADTGLRPLTAMAGRSLLDQINAAVIEDDRGV
jgi:Fe-S-cluster containining protein